MGQLRGAGAAGLGDRDHHINIARRQSRNDALGQRLAQVQAGLVNRNAVHGGVGARQINVFKNAWAQLRFFGARLGVHLAIQVDKNSFTWGHIALKLVPRAIQRHRLAGQHDRTVFATTHAQGADAVRIAKSHQTVARDQGDHRVRAFDTAVHAAHSLKYINGFERQTARGLLQLVGQHVEQDFGVAVGVDVAVVIGKQLGLERVRIGQVAVVHQHQAKRGIHIKRLCFFFAEGVACCGVAHLPQTTVARQAAHVARAEHVAHHALGLVHEKLAVQLRDDARRVLTPVLQKQQGVINQLIDRSAADNADNSTHTFNPFKKSMRPEMFKANNLPAPAAAKA